MGRIIRVKYLSGLMKVFVKPGFIFYPRSLSFFLLTLSLGGFFLTGCAEFPGSENSIRTSNTGGRLVLTSRGPVSKMNPATLPGGGAQSGDYQGVRVFNAPYEKVIKAVEKTISYKKYPIEVYDEEKGIIESGYRMHDGLFTMGFMGAKMRSRMVAQVAELAPQKVEVILKTLVEKEDDTKTWHNFPINDYNLDLVDSESYEMLFYFISEHIKTGKIPQLVY